jgi:deoxyribonuclease-4
VGAGEDEGLRLVAAALDQVHRDLPGLSVVTCLEVTAGQGTGLGYRFEHLRRIIDMVGEPGRLAVCLDTAHLLAAGYDLTSAAGCLAMLDELDACLGLGLVKVIHVNDSKTPRGSRVDRHAHIGRGFVASEAFRTLLRHKQFRRTPMILETPKEKAPDGRDWDTVNLEALRRLAAPKPGPGPRG